MALPPNLDHDQLSEAVLAILGLTAHTDHGSTRVWKGLDWALLDGLPVGMPGDIARHRRCRHDRR